MRGVRLQSMRSPQKCQLAGVFVHAPFQIRERRGIVARGRNRRKQRQDWRRLLRNRFHARFQTFQSVQQWLNIQKFPSSWKSAAGSCGPGAGEDSSRSRR